MDYIHMEYHIEYRMDYIVFRSMFLHENRLMILLLPAKMRNLSA